MTDIKPLPNKRLEALEQLRHERGRLHRGQEIVRRSLSAYPNDETAAKHLESELAQEQGLAPPDPAVREALKAIRLASLKPAPHIADCEPVTDSRYAMLVTEKLHSVEFDEFLAFFSSYKERTNALGLAIEYLIIHKDGYDFENYLKAIMGIQDGVPFLDSSNTTLSGDFKKERNRLIINSIRSRLGEDGSDDEKVFQYFTQEFTANGFFFHSFNGLFENSIRKEGLKTDTRFWDWDELDRVIEIGKKYGNRMILGWGDINSRDKISFGADVANIYRYGIASPEWFAQFVAEGFHILMENDSGNKQAFYARDYDLARQNIIRYCHWESTKPQSLIDKGRAYPNLEPKEREELLAFFEKYWDLFSSDSSKPKLAMVKKSVTGHDLVIYSTLEEFKESPGSTPSDPLEFYVSMNLNTYGSMHCDIQVKENIPSSELEIIDLPEYEKMAASQ